jgi:ABC-type nitrate/sulfonate/bicarbonate transport system permease component
MSGPIASALMRRPAWVRVSYIVLFLVFWELVARFYADPLFVAPPSAVAGAVVDILSDRGVVRALEVALGEIVAAFTLSVIVGIVAGLLIGLTRIGYHGFFKIVLVLYGIPKVTIFPLILLYFGLGAGTKITFGFVHGVFPILVAVVAGVQNVDPLLLRAAASMGAKRRHVFRWIVFPHLVPSLFTGMRLGMGGVLIGVILAELYVSALGIGYYTTRFSQGFQPARLFALVAVLALMAILLNELMRLAESRFSRGRLAGRG